MPKQILILIAFIVIAISFFVVNETGVFETDDTISPNATLPFSYSQLENSQNERLVNSGSMNLNDKLSNELIKAGWESKAAHTVIGLNQEWFEILQTEYPQDLEKQVYLLKDLGNYPQLMPLFKARPETAALLAGTDEPEHLAQSLEWDQCYDVVMGLFAQHTAHEDTIALADALAIHRSLMCRLIKRGLIGSQALFIFLRNNPGAQEYDNWLDEVLDSALSQSDEKLSSLINLLFEQGTIIRRKMIGDDQFRYTFRNDLWPKLTRVSNKTQLPFELYISDPHLWDLLALPQGERLLEQWVWFLSLEQVNNLTPADVLFGDEAYPISLHSFIIDAILDQDANTLIALLHFGYAPLFVNLIQRQLPEEVKQKAFNTLIAQGPNYPITLEDWDKASDADLHFELVNNGSSLTHTIKKTIQGREVSNSEAIWATLDVADIAIMAVTLGTGAIITSGVKLTAKQGLKTVVKQQVSLKQQANDFIKQNPTMRKIISENVLMSTAKKQLIQKMQLFFRKMNDKESEYATIEITPVLQFFFKKMNVNRKTIKRINNSWDARLFMRKDAKVLVNVDYKKLSSATCLFFRITSVTDTTGVVSGIAREAVCGLADHFENEAMYKLIASSKIEQQLFRAWQKNNSAWFLMNASGMTARQ